MPRLNLNAWKVSYLPQILNTLPFLYTVPNQTDMVVSIQPRETYFNTSIWPHCWKFFWFAVWHVYQYRVLLFRLSVVATKCMAAVMAYLHHQEVPLFSLHRPLAAHARYLPIFTTFCILAEVGLQNSNGPLTVPDICLVGITLDSIFAFIFLPLDREGIHVLSHCQERHIHAIRCKFYANIICSPSYIKQYSW